MQGRTIKIHLVEGTPNGVTTVEIIASWTGQVILAPQAKVAELAKRPEVQRSGVYILVGDDPDNPGKEQVYVGESDNVLSRLKQHIANGTKEFWNRSIIVVSKDEHLTKSLIRYLESRLIQVIGQARRATLDNGTAPERPKLPESDKADMEYFLEQIQMLLPVLGFTFILPIPAVQTPSVTPLQGSIDSSSPRSDSPVFEMGISGAAATAQEIAGEFVVLRGSTAQGQNADSLSRSYVELRRQLSETGKLKSVDNGTGSLIFGENVSFKSPSAAASVVAGSNQNGRITWKVEGQTYKAWQQAQIDAQGATVIDGVDDHNSQ